MLTILARNRRNRVTYIMGMADQTADRFSEFDSERVVIWELYIRDVFVQRPLFNCLA